MAYIKVLYKQYSDMTRQGDPDDRWDGDDTYSSYDIEGVQQVDEQGFYDVQTSFDLDGSKVYHLLCVVYSTGDSFHHEENGVIEFIGLYDDLEEARENERRLNKHHELFKHVDNMRPSFTQTKREKSERRRLLKTFNPESVTLVEDGKEYSVGASWHGYFERLSEIRVQPVLVH